ncbi:hydroxymethylglutaryl-CoA lyase [Cytobacillus horneckiae]|uniref:Hydroxymethylglutaryl-CoA lyase n=1 Tax=Cytobacillus horneckiae TaxID=549687 RepID=A0A2N0ZIR7_9BACI|nr:hydroxymethylglutaryl-CoA lyase [Cytobacillus horneckiae]MBN6886639.1 hydroxymethylglutaryl-CoA lyase [Cytobacillus horneckiae]MCM3177890.1 hydroxymethylglutaryl-CoA lyase [Cytobacillus horneckiae]MEC1157303.1 hydroxymethylglutaryl-CoA lyase [Cytobacillus horneckiae]MED2935816.1 hydroxymethylglutaryl-CoA lyase [Cytobacillus horneckiae]PKG29402.1 hydroxymethylglutaryl-CoA lyase [Cytobacillus horneckiae]
MRLSEEVTINEVGLRDGLQLESTVLSASQKAVIYTHLKKANVQEIEFGSFVHPKLVPQMANTGEFFEKIKGDTDVILTALIPNLRGLERANEYGVNAANFVFSASNTHNLQNVRQTTEQSLESLKIIVQYASAHQIDLHISIATSFGCPFEGTAPQENIMKITEQLLNYNIKRITYADTTGMANPMQVNRLMKEIKQEWKNFEFGCHFHNTRGMGLVNILAAMEANIAIFDSSLGGIGGCPFAPGATGNVCSEDVVHMLEEMGVRTGVDLDELLQASLQLKEFLGHELPGQVMKAGKSTRRYPVPN